MKRKSVSVKAEFKSALKNVSTGFSLIEILVVVALIGIAVTVVSVTVGQGGLGKELDKAVEKFAAYSAHASDMAVISNEPMGLVLEPPAWREDTDLDEPGWHYRWQKMTREGWVDYEALQPVDLDPQYELLVFIEEQEWKIEKAPKNKLPIIAFYPGGDVTQFEIEFSHRDLPDETEHIKVDEWGDVVWVEGRAAEEAIKKLLGEEGDF